MAAKGDTPRLPRGVPWITKEGTLDLREFPIDSVLKQGLGEKEEKFRTGCRLLGSMHRLGRAEAGVYLLGLLRYWRHDLSRLAVVVENLALCHTPVCADALFSELRRVPSSNETRGYLKTVLKSLSHFPVELVADGLEELADDRSFSYKMRHKFRELLAEMEGRARLI